ncbi:phosphopantetheine-binding protein [Helicobacter burdigaliensis]|uniref:phosphopantetheine-binding protein n=1 Tax=Helicobacter burdigaliensis TaxID=2315334 RepID=UPI000EF6873C|nr:phosphopantetheine-binding protein [Helicobacter burdigaliensis]
MQEIKQFFENIGKDSIDENMDNLVKNGFIDSLDIMNLVAEIEQFYQTTLDFDDIVPENFESFKTIKKMIELSVKNK